MFNKQFSPREETLDNSAEVPAKDDETPAPEYPMLPYGVKPGVDGLPLVTLVGAMIVGILMWAGFFAIIGALLGAF